MPNYVKKPVTIQASPFGAKDFLYWEPWVQEGYDKKEWGYRFDPNTGALIGLEK